MTDEQVLTLISMTAKKHGLKIGEIDLEKRIINFVGPKENEPALARELADLLGDYEC